VDCLNCHAELQGACCHVCGQAARSPRTSLGGFLLDTLGGFVGADSRFPRSIRSLLLTPGRLTKAWIEGHRAPYSAPTTLYLFFASIIFLNAYRPFIHFDPQDDSITSSLTGALVERRLPADQTAALHSGELSATLLKERLESGLSVALAPWLIVAVVLFSFLTAVLMARRDHRLAHHAVFALHWCDVFLLLEALQRLVDGGRAGEVLTGVLGLGYLIIATGRVYGGWLRAILMGPLLYLGFWPPSAFGSGQRSRSPWRDRRSPSRSAGIVFERRMERHHEPGAI
jgi:hypothetical protein